MGGIRCWHLKCLAIQQRVIHPVTSFAKGGRPRQTFELFDLGQIFPAASGAICCRDNEKNVMSENQNASLKKGTVVYACSGCSDAGELADRIARQLTREGVAEMSCLAGIGGRVKPLVNKANAAERILAIDGCPLNCTRHTLELAGFKNFDHLELHKFGLRKGSCPVTEEKIATGVAAAKAMLSNAASNTLVQPGAGKSSNSLTSIKEPNSSTN